jgi:phage terminase small subunit
MALTGKQRRFVAEYLIDLNATQAAIRAGYSERTASAIGAENLKKPQIVDAISVSMKDRGARTEVTSDRVLLEAARLALFDPRKLFDGAGNPKPIHELDDDTAAAIAGVEVIQICGEEGPAIIKKYKISDKNSALEKLFKHHGLYEKDHKQANDPIAQFLASMARSALPVKSDE